MNVKNYIKKITIVGAGNVGHNFGKGFKNAGYIIHEVYSKTQTSASLLGHSLSCDYTTDLTTLKADTDLIILAVNDDVLASVIAQIKIKDKLMVHTSGSTPISVFEAHDIENYGILYPVQSFSKNETESLEPIPFCVEGNNAKTSELLYSLARSVSRKVYAMDSDKRKSLHVAAVFANNFSNHMFHIADDLLRKHEISFEVIRPLLEKTASKIHTERPKDVQTGPAVRNDRKVIEEHLNYLKNNSTYRELYQKITDSIYKSKSGDA